MSFVLLTMLRLLVTSHTYLLAQGVKTGFIVRDWFEKRMSSSSIFLWGVESEHAFYVVFCIFFYAQCSAVV